MDRGAWQATVYEVAKNQTCLTEQAPRAPLNTLKNKHQIDKTVKLRKIQGKQKKKKKENERPYKLWLKKQQFDNSCKPLIIKNNKIKTTANCKKIYSNYKRIKDNENPKHIIR